MKKYLYIIVLLMSASMLNAHITLAADINGFTRQELRNAGFQDDQMEIIRIVGITKDVIDRGIIDARSFGKTYPALYASGFMDYLRRASSHHSSNDISNDRLHFYFSNSQQVLQQIVHNMQTVERARRLVEVGERKLLEDQADDRRRATDVAKIQAWWKGALMFFSKKLFIYGTVSICVVIFAYYVIKYTIRYLFGVKAPVIIKKTSLPTKWYERFPKGFYKYWPFAKFKKKRPTSRYKDLIYNEMLMKRLKEEIELTKQIVKKKREKGQGSKLGFGSIILEGPSGTGKTLFAETLALEAKCDFIIIDGPRWAQMDTKDALKNYYEFKAYLDSLKGCVVVFFDEADAIFSKRNGAGELGQKLTSAFLATNQKSFNNKIKWIFATNYIENCDDALINRSDKTIEVPLPDEDTCYRTCKHYVSKEAKKFNVSLAYDFEDHREVLGKALLGLSGREIEAIAKGVVQKSYLYKGKVDYVFLKEAIESRKNFKEKNLVSR